MNDEMANVGHSRNITVIGGHPTLDRLLYNGEQKHEVQAGIYPVEAVTESPTKNLTCFLRKVRSSTIVNLLPVCGVFCENSAVDYAAATTAALQHAIANQCNYVHVSDACVYGQKDLMVNRDAYHPYDPAVPDKNHPWADVVMAMERQVALFMTSTRLKACSTHLLRFGSVLPTHGTNTFYNDRVDLAQAFDAVMFNDKYLIDIKNKLRLVSPVTDQYVVQCIYRLVKSEDVPNGVYNIGLDESVTVSRFFNTLAMKMAKQVTVTDSSESDKIGSRKILNLVWPASNQAVLSTSWRKSTGMKLESLSDICNKVVKQNNSTLTEASFSDG